MYDFELLTATSLQEAVTALQDEETQALAGGQTLIPTMKQRLASPERLVSLTKIKALQGVTATAQEVVIGAAARHADVAVEAAAFFPALADLAGHIGDPAVRNRGTIGGSLANNDPAACYPAAVLACGAVIETNLRQIAAKDYFDGMFGTALDDGELITVVRFPIPKIGHYENSSSLHRALRLLASLWRDLTMRSAWQSLARRNKGFFAGLRPRRRFQRNLNRLQSTILPSIRPI